MKQNGTKEEQKKVARKVHERYPNIQLGQYFMTLLGLVMVMALVGMWMRVNGQMKWVQVRRPVAVPRNRSMRAAALRSMSRPSPLRTGTPSSSPTQTPHHAPRPPLNATRRGKITQIRNVGLARTGHLPNGRLMGGFGSMGRMGGLGGFGRR